jgi:acyl-coenzyme A synthetase/AMP-(fatty) acid ligase
MDFEARQRAGFADSPPRGWPVGRVIRLRREALPLVRCTHEAFAFADTAPVSTSAFRDNAASLASGLAATGAVVNLCEDRYRFLVAFSAALSRGKTTLLPSSHAPAAVAELVAAHPDCSVLDDAGVAGTGGKQPQELAEPPEDFIAVIGHTSGSTGKPASHAKTWSGLRATTALNAATIRAAIGGNASAQQPWIVATVPPQHMYGLETSVLLPLLAGFGIHSGRPLLPADVAAALDEVPAPRVLVTTPVHLRSLVESGVCFPDVDVVVSATAPLQRELAQRVEKRLRAVLIEMFGSTETCVIATRRTSQDAGWRPYPGVRLEPMEGSTIVSAPWLAGDQLLHDIVAVRADHSFAVIGRHSDLVEVAGKRASLADLTQRMISLPGVEDAIVFQPATESGGVRRCAALVVAPGLSAREILRRFRREVDAVFLPRPLVVVPALPRNLVGKLSMERMLALLGTARSS